ncbi:metal-dependent hydrolase [Spartinivicinus ruber]|uniref:metal-dependent hydrolase n=1 Tax=Spartinivicinus ruber TaxID=2683272 RepID=UPI0013D74284|nr:metal-dependent hydrolase [Spartinivicinus ruber]
MANFNTHINVAATCGGVVAITGLGEGILSISQALIAWVLISIGGILPDVDSDHAKPVKALFTALAAGAVVLVVTHMQPMPPTPVLLVVGISVYLVVRILGYKVFAQFSAHRGIYHSLLAGALFMAATIVLCHQVLSTNAILAWGSGVAIALGFLIHLVLDEIYSVDLVGVRIKRSFGTAIKPIDFRNPLNSLVMAGIVVGLFFLAPSPEPFAKWFSNQWLGRLI